MSNETACAAALVSLFSGGDTTDADSYLMLAASGHGIGDLGDYSLCSELPQAAYGWVGVNITYAIGLCLPSVCGNDSILAQTLGQLVELLPILRFNTSSVMVQVVHEDDLQLDSILFILACCILALGVVYSTSVDLLSRWRIVEEDPQLYTFLEEPEVTSKIDKRLGPAPKVDSGLPVATKAFSAVSSLEHLFTLSKRAPPHSASLGEKEGKRDAFPFQPSTVQGTEVVHGHLDGLRSVSILWILLSATYSSSLPLVKNPFFLSNFLLRQFSFQVVLSGQFLPYDTLFFLSGFLIAEAVPALLKTRGPSSLPLLAVHRLTRFLPTLVFSLFMYWKISGFMGNGPAWYMFQHQREETCDDHWWATLLFVQNFTPTNKSEICMSWTWLLASDLQLSLLAILVLWLHYKHPRAAIGILAFVLTSCLLAVGLQTGLQNLSLDVVSPKFSSFFENVMVKPHSSAIPFVVGILSFLVLQHVRSLYPRTVLDVGGIFSRPVQLLSFAFITLLIFTAVFIPYSDYMDGLLSWSPAIWATYVVLSKLFFAVGLGALTVLCQTGDGGVVYSLLSLEFFQPMAKLSFSAYMVYQIVVDVIYFSSGDLLYLTSVTILSRWITNSILTFLVAILVYVFVEYPFRQLEKALFSKIVSEN